MSEPGGRRVLKVSEVVRETADAVSVLFDDAGEAVEYRPGQYLVLRIPSDRTGHVARCYSLASSPHRGEAPRVIVKRTRGGFASNWICDNLSGGDTIEVLAPTGVFGPRALDDDLSLFAAGSGITPVLSIAKSVLAQGVGTVDLFYANRDEASVIAAGELQALEEEFSGRLTVNHWLESLQGLPRPSALEQFIEKRPGREAYVCGPGAFMDAVRAAWAKAGRDHSELHLEVFTSLTGDPFSVQEIVVPKDVGDAVPLGVTLEGEEHLLEWPKGVTLVDFLLSKGLEVPYMCRDGECGTCLATCTSGKVSMNGNNLLEEDDLANGVVLACQLVVDGDEPVEVAF